MFFQVCFGIILCVHFALVDAFSESKRDQAPKGKCLSFKWEREDDEIDYVCCNNCAEENEHCFGKTYGSTGDYCNSCGRNKLSFARKLSMPFSCGGCNGQTHEANTCKRWYSSLPVGCWLFRGCFETACQNIAGEEGLSNYNPFLSDGVPGETPYYDKQVGSKLGSCFNGVCDDGEYIENCPADCCIKRNPQKCTLLQGLCPPECCGEPHCCVERKESKISQKVKTIILCVTLSIVCLCIGCILYRLYSCIKRRVQVGDY